MKRALAILASLAAGLAVLAACNRAPDSAKMAPLAALDPCAIGETAPNTLCSDAKLAALASQVSRALSEKAASISDAGSRLLIEGQQRWLAAQRMVCGARVPEATLTGPQARCLESKLRDRVQRANDAVQQVGGYTFQRVEIVGADAVTPEAAEASGLGADAPPAILRDISFPRIDGAATPQAQRFNQLAVQQPQFRQEDQTEESVAYNIVYAGPNIISVKFTTYENTLGAAHPDNGFRAVTVMMREGRLLEASDVFRVGSGWENFLTQRAIAELTRQFAEYSFQPAPTDVRDTATKAHLWLVSQSGLTLLFPPYSFGGPHAIGGAEVQISWADLRPYLAPNAPAPIGAGA